MDCVSLLTGGLNLLFAFIISESFDFPFLYCISFCNSVVIPDYVSLKGFCFFSFKRQIIQMYNTSLRNIAANCFCLDSYIIQLLGESTRSPKTQELLKMESLDGGMSCSQF